MAQEKRIPIFKCENCGERFSIDNPEALGLKVLDYTPGNCFLTSGQRDCIIHECKGDQVGLSFTCGYKIVATAKAVTAPIIPQAETEIQDAEKSAE